MGDASDMADVDRFMRSTEGQAYLKEFAGGLAGKAIQEVSFSNDTHEVGVLLHLNNGRVMALSCSMLSLDMLRAEFADVLEREYYMDFPERWTGHG